MSVFVDNLEVADLDYKIWREEITYFIRTSR